MSEELVFNIVESSSEEESDNQDAPTQVHQIVDDESEISGEEDSKSNESSEESE